MIIKRLTVKYNYGDVVALKTEPEIKRIVTGYNVRHRLLSYWLSFGVNETLHQDIEIESFHEKKLIGLK